MLLGILLPTLSLSICESLDLLRGQSLSLVDISCTYNLIGVFSFLIPWVGYKDFVFSGLYDREISNEVLLKGCKYLMFFTFISLILAFFFLGGVPFIRMIRGNLSVDEYNDLLGQLPMGLMLIIGTLGTMLYLNFANFIIFARRRKIFNLFTVTLFLLCLLSSLWQGKRQGLFLFIFIVMTFIFQKYKLTFNFRSIKKILGILILLFVFFKVFTNIGSTRNNTDDVNQYELLQYAMFAPMNWAYMTDLFSPYGTTIIPTAILFEIIPRRLGDGTVDYRDSLFEPTSPSGYFSYWYADYGILGLIIGGFLLGYISKKTYMFRGRSEYRMCLYVLILWCCSTVAIYSHLLTITMYVKIFLLNMYFSKLSKFSLNQEI